MNITDVSSNSATSGTMDGVSGASSYTSASDTDLSQARSLIQQDSQNFKSLRNALQSGDLASAQNAYSTLQQQIQTASQSTGKNLFDANSSIGKDFKAIGTALQSGNLAEAQKAFTSFRQDIRTARHHRHGTSATSATDNTTDTADATSTTDSSNTSSPVNSTSATTSSSTSTSLLNALA